MKKILTAVISAAVLVPMFAFASVDINLLGGSVTVVRGTSYVEPGYSANSTVDGNITGNVSVTNPGTLVPGSFLITYNVTDSVLDSATASRGLTVLGSGGGMIFCSGPLAPGWNTSVPDGNCGSKTLFVPFNSPLKDGSKCEFFMGCMDVK